MSQVVGRVRLSKEVKERIIFLAYQGLQYDQIAKEVGCKLLQVSGYLRSAANWKLIPPEIATAGSTRARKRREDQKREKDIAKGIIPPDPVAPDQRSEEAFVHPSMDTVPAVEISGSAEPVAERSPEPEPVTVESVQDIQVEPVVQDVPVIPAVQVPSEMLQVPQAQEPVQVKLPPEPSVQAPIQVQVPVVPSAPAPAFVAAQVAVPVEQPKVASEEIKVPQAAPLPTPPVVKRSVPVLEKKMAAQPAPGQVQLPAAAAPQSVAPPAQAGWSGGNFAQGYAGGFMNSSLAQKYQVERKIPADGIVGHHTGNFTEADLCQLYGAGLYKILRFEPGRPIPIEHEVRVADSFGAPRNPNAAIAGQQARTSRYAPQSRGQDDEGAPPSRYERPYYDRERALYEFARNQPAQAPSVANDVTAEAIRQLGEANKRAQDQIEASRKGGPDAMVTNFFQNQQELMQRRMEQDAKAQDERRREEAEKWERRQEEAEKEHRRRQEEDEKRHIRDLERIRMESEARQKSADNERKLVMELEDKKLALIREEAKLRQDILQQELQANREAMKSLQEQTTIQIDAVKEAMEKELSKDREGLEREHKIREKALDKEHELSSKILDIKQESLQKQGGDQMFNLLDTVVKEFGQGLKAIVDLNKMQSMTPEAQAASIVGKTMDGGVVQEPRRQEAPQVRAAADVVAGQAAESGPEVSAPQEEDGGKLKVDTIIQAMVEQPIFKQVLREWSRQVKLNEDPTAFAGMFLDWQQDPSDFQGRKACSMFVNFIKTRSWAEALEVMGPKLDRDVLASFKTEYAADFYESFKVIVVEHVKMYFDDFIEGRKLKASQKEAPAAPAAPEVVEARGEPEVEAAEEPEGVPVPTRSSLRPVK